MLSKRSKKLSLSKQCIRVLTNDQQRTVVGGVATRSATFVICDVTERCGSATFIICK